MPDSSLLTIVSAALGGGVAVKLIEVVYQDLKDWRTGRSDHSRNVERNLEPLLRAADELVGKLRSLAQQDFLPIRQADISDFKDPGIGSVFYLFVQFWSEIEIVRFRGLPAPIAKSRKGRQTQAFLRCLESRHLRLIDRISQRAVGEAALIGNRTMNYVEFMKSIDHDAYVLRWLEPLTHSLGALDTSEARQKLLQYSVVVHAMIDTLDKDRLATRERPAIPNKLNRRSKRELNYRVFGVYLPFVKDRGKYIGPLN